MKRLLILLVVVCAGLAAYAGAPQKACTPPAATLRQDDPGYDAYQLMHRAVRGIAVEAPVQACAPAPRAMGGESQRSHFKHMAGPGAPEKVRSAARITGVYSSAPVAAPRPAERLLALGRLLI